MKIDLGSGQYIERREADEDCAVESCIWISLLCDFDGGTHEVSMTPETARNLLDALRQLDQSGLLED